MTRWLSLAFCCLAATAAGQTSPDATHLGELMNARNFAMGQAYRAHGYGTEAIDGNPAALPLYKRYQVELTGGGDWGLGWGLGGVGLADSASSDVGFGLSYHFVSYGRDETKRSAHLTTVAAALPIGELFSLGLSVRHQVIVGEPHTNSVTMGAGVIVRPLQFLTLAASGHNLIGVWNPDVRRFFSFGASANLGFFTPAFDMTADFEDPGAPRFTFGGGLEWIAADTFPIRGGYLYDTHTRTHFVSAGLGLFEEGSGIDVSYRHELGGQSRLVVVTLKAQFR